MRTKMAAVLCFIAVAVSAPVRALPLDPAQDRAVLLDVAPEFQQANAGVTFSVDVRASGVPADEVISGFNLLLGYDSSLIRPLGVAFSGALGDPDHPDQTLNESVLDFDPVDGAPLGYGGYRGQSSVAVQFANLSFSFDPFADLKAFQQPEPFSLASIAFEVLVTTGQGAWTQTLLELMNDDAWATVPPDTGGNFDVKGKDVTTILASKTQNGTAEVPVPSPLLLMLAPFLLLLGWPRSLWPA